MFSLFLCAHFLSAFLLCLHLFYVVFVTSDLSLRGYTGVINEFILIGSKNKRKQLQLKNKPNYPAMA